MVVGEVPFPRLGGRERWGDDKKDSEVVPSVECVDTTCRSPDALVARDRWGRQKVTRGSNERNRKRRKVREGTKLRWYEMYRNLSEEENCACRGRNGSVGERGERGEGKEWERTAGRSGGGPMEVTGECCLNTQRTNT